MLVLLCYTYSQFKNLRNTLQMLRDPFLTLFWGCILTLGLFYTPKFKTSHIVTLLNVDCLLTSACLWSQRCISNRPKSKTQNLLLSFLLLVQFYGNPTSEYGIWHYFFLHWMKVTKLPQSCLFVYGQIDAMVFYWTIWMSIYGVISLSKWIIHKCNNDINLELNYVTFLRIWSSESDFVTFIQKGFK